MRTASIDIGTNTVRLLICEELSDGTLGTLYVDRIITRLGEGFSQDREQITPNAISRTTSALINFSETLKRYEVSKLRAVATSAVRKSENASEFLDKAKKESGIEIEVISGDQEAELTVLGVLNSIRVTTDEYIIFDIGGGSTEYVHILKDKIVNKKSINLGVVHLTEEYLSKDIETPKEITQLTDIIKTILEKELNDYKTKNKEFTLIGTAGTPTTLAAMELRLKDYKPELINNHKLSINTV
ncbi:MAG: hypothetical protein GWN56_04560, partial [Nitrosopumilaceae archaeon]|nr:hypothetical protein [Nitrosopumilaceae archaeon]NIV65272.1 hypothetical protein [Nitrosopumilaceae archaeon]